MTHRAPNSHTSPVPWKELRDWLIHKRGAVFVRQGGTHIRMRLPNGQSCNIVATQENVSNVVMRAVVDALNWTQVDGRSVPIPPTDRRFMRYPDLREALGYPVQQRNKGKAERQQTTRHGKGDVRRLLEQVRYKLNSLEQEIERDRDPSVYKRLCGALLGADDELTGYFHEDAVIRQHVQVS
jgi:hypothetical protein